jgi:hypothetical protein
LWNWIRWRVRLECRTILARERVSIQSHFRRERTDVRPPEQSSGQAGKVVPLDRPERDYRNLRDIRDVSKSQPALLTGVLKARADIH